MQYFVYINIMKPPPIYPFNWPVSLGKGIGTLVYVSQLNEEAQQRDEHLQEGCKIYRLQHRLKTCDDGRGKLGHDRSELVSQIRAHWPDVLDVLVDSLRYDWVGH